MGSVLVAAVVAFIAWQQWRTARNKLSLDLFDKRFAVYQRLSEALSRRHHECHHHPNVFTSDIFRWRDFYLASHDAGLLFGKDVVGWIDKMDEALGDLQAQHDRLLSKRVTPDKLLDDPDFAKANFAYIKAHIEYERHVRAYMFLGHIGRTKPEKRAEWDR